MWHDEPTNRRLRYALALVLVATIPLAIWGGGCGSNTVVEPPADAGPTDSATDRDDAASDAVDALGADDAGPLQCCSSAQSNQKQCSPDGTEVLLCNYYFAAGPNCVESSKTSYGYVWRPSPCPNGCAISTVASVTEARCQ